MTLDGCTARVNFASLCSGVTSFSSCLLAFIERTVPKTNNVITNLFREASLCRVLLYYSVGPSEPT